MSTATAPFSINQDRMSAFAVRLHSAMAAWPLATSNPARLMSVGRMLRAYRTIHSRGGGWGWDG
jgi:hypothetical protein